VSHNLAAVGLLTCAENPRLVNRRQRDATFYYSLLSTAQLYSTASYQAHNLRGIGLHGNYPGINLAGQNLTGAHFGNGAELSQANLSQANLTSAVISAGLAEANFRGAEIRGAAITSISIAQLYSTASYQARDLTEIDLNGNSLSGANFASQNLTRASFYGATLTNANFHLANLSNASFTYPFGQFPPFGVSPTDLVGANLSHANLTRARFGGEEECQGEFCWFFEGANLSGANLTGADATWILPLRQDDQHGYPEHDSA